MIDDTWGVGVHIGKTCLHPGLHSVDPLPSPDHSQDLLCPQSILPPQFPDYHRFSEEKFVSQEADTSFPKHQAKTTKLPRKKGIFSPVYQQSPKVGRGHLHWEPCPEYKVLQHKAGVVSPKQRVLDTHPLAEQFEPPQPVWPNAACFLQYSWVPRHLCGSNVLGSCSHSH